jgi:hypothetical protein
MSIRVSCLGEVSSIWGLGPRCHSARGLYPWEDVVGGLFPKVSFFWRVDDAFIILNGQWLSNQISLNLIATLVAQNKALRFGLDALSQHRQIETARQCDDSSDNLSVIIVGI